MDIEQEEQSSPRNVPPIVFIGLADHAEASNEGDPYESHSFFAVARVKPHFTFPTNINRARWCFLIDSSEFSAITGGALSVKILAPNGKEVANISFDKAEPIIAPSETHDAVPIIANHNPVTTKKFCLDKDQWVFMSAGFQDFMVAEPGEYTVSCCWVGKQYRIGRIIFAFHPPPELTTERIGALESDPTMPKAVQATYGCKHCDSKLKAYAAVNKSNSIEEAGYIFYKELPDEFVCTCGKTKFSMSYARAGLHGFLYPGARIALGEISYVQRYAHSQLTGLASSFLKLIKTETKEEVIQQHLEKNKVLFARFSANKLFTKPRILGKFNADFALLDSRGALVLIEIERPNMRLFKKNGHLRAEFNHAYEQVEDWLNEYGKHPAAVIEGLGLKQDQVLSVRGCVIAGAANAEKREHLQRHMSQARSNIDFLTFDMLGQSLLELANKLP